MGKKRAQVIVACTTLKTFNIPGVFPVMLCTRVLAVENNIFQMELHAALLQFYTGKKGA